MKLYTLDNQFIKEANFIPNNFTGILEWQDSETRHYYYNSKLHRTDGPAVEYPDGSKYWYLNDKLHRIDGPAVENSDGTKEWFLNGKRHRTDGPAVEYPDGFKYWYLDNKQITKEQHTLYVDILKLKGLL